MDFHQIWYVHLLWRFGFGLLIGKFRQYLTELSACDMIIAGYYRFAFYFFLGYDNVKAENNNRNSTII